MKQSLLAQNLIMFPTITDHDPVIKISIFSTSSFHQDLLKTLFTRTTVVTKEATTMILEHLSRLQQKKIILASQSPRRREILNLMGLPFLPVPSNFEENLDKSSFKTPRDYVIANAHGKAACVAASLPDADLVIGSDTVVVLDGKILEKPASEGEAFRMLKALSGRQHTVFTGVALIVKGGSAHTFCEDTAVWFADMTDDMIAAYIKTGEPMDKAGAYGIQGRGGVFVQKIDGCFFAVMGLPMHALGRGIAKLCNENML